MSTMRIRTGLYKQMNYFNLNYNDKIGIVCCSNGRPHSDKNMIDKLEKNLRYIGLQPVFSDCIYCKYSVFSGSGEERAAALMNFYKDNSVKAVFDISGGDLANEILPYLDYDTITQSKKTFWGYSDLTALINAIFAKTGNKSVLYAVKNLVYDHAEIQNADFANTVFMQKDKLFDFPLFNFPYKFIQGTEMNGVTVGGNIRCFLKLAGTEFFPNVDGKILVLEALGGEVPQTVTYLNQLKQIGVFNKISGIVLGTFTQMSKNNCIPDIVSLVKKYVGSDLPIVKTDKIGHGSDSKAVIIGEYYSLRKQY